MGLLNYCVFNCKIENAIIGKITHKKIIGKITHKKIMADLHNDITYEGWGKTSAAGHTECMRNSKRVLKRSISLQHGRTDRLHALIISTPRGGVFISETNGHIGVRYVAR